MSNPAPASSPVSPPAIGHEPDIWARFLTSQGRAWASWLPVGVGLGAVGYLSLPFEPSPVYGIVVAVIGLGLLGWGAARPVCRIWGSVLLTLGAGFLLCALQTRTRPPMPALPTRATVIHGRVLSMDTIPRIRPEDAMAGNTLTESATGSGTGSDREETTGAQGLGRRIVLGDAVFDSVLDRGMAPLARTLKITLRKDDPTPLAPGETVSVRAMLRPPPPPSFPGGRDLQRESWFSGSAGSGYALGGVSVNGGDVSRPDLWLERIRENVAHRVEAVLPGQTGAVVAVLLAGEGAAIDPGTRASFAASGLAHLLAVAGLHLGLVSGCVVVILRALLALWPRAVLNWPCREIAVVVGLVVGAGYVTLTGAHLPSVRALGMAVIVTLAILTGRRVLSMRALSCVALAIVVMSPVSVLDVSFQMSFAAVMALIAGYDALRVPLLRLRGEGQFWRVMASHLATLSLTSLLAGCATLPVSMAHFGVFQPWFVLANLIAVPIAAVWIMPAGVIALVLMPFHLDGGALHVMGVGVWIVRALAAWVAGFPAARLPVPMMPGWGLLVFMLGLSGLCLWRGRWRLVGIAPIALGLASIAIAPRPVLLLSADAGLMAVRQGGTLLVGPHNSLERRALEDWTQALALPPAAFPQECAQGPCRVRVGTRTLLLRPVDRTDGRTRPAAELCRDIALYVSASPARNACPGVPALDRFSAWRDGAWAIYEGRHGLHLVSDRSWRGARLWVPGVGSRGMPNWPLAQSE